jgi:hypothetical protein
MMRAVARAFSVRGIREIRDNHSSARTIFAVIVAEFRRAVTAARRYEDLRYGGGRHEGVSPADIPRRVFEEFYSEARAVESRRAQWSSEVARRRSGVPRGADPGERVIS